VGKPFRAYRDRLALLYDGEGADRRILRFVATDTKLDTIPSGTRLGPWILSPRSD
jgi:hypothetical protein